MEERKTGIDDLPEEIIVLIFKELQHEDIIGNCFKTSLRWQKIVIEHFMQPYLRKLSRHHLDLRKLFENVGWSENCYENDLILNLFEKHTMCNKKTPQETHLQVEHIYEFDVEKAKTKNLWSRSPILLLPIVLTILGFLYLALRRYGVLHVH